MDGAFVNETFGADVNNSEVFPISVLRIIIFIFCECHLIKYSLNMNSLFLNFKQNTQNISNNPEM